MGKGRSKNLADIGTYFSFNTSYWRPEDLEIIFECSAVIDMYLFMNNLSLEVIRGNFVKCMKRALHYSPNTYDWDIWNSFQNLYEQEIKSLGAGPLSS